MIFSSPLYLVFLFVCVCVYWRLTTNLSRKLFLLAASLVFYAWWDPRLLPLLLGTCLLNYFIGVTLFFRPKGRERKLIAVVGVAANLFILCYFKYANFFLDGIRDLGLAAHGPGLKILLPLGISFFTFQGISYVVDIYKGKLKRIPSLLDFIFFKIFFPQLIAGPIVRALEFLPQLRTRRTLKDVHFRQAISLFLIGYIKKALIADNLATLIDPVFTQDNEWSAMATALATVGYTVQIYCDFSGYTDMARASAAMFGYELPENFRWPYLATDLKMYWTRWHMSLSRWLRDYLYIPLGGNRRGPFRKNLNVMITMLLGGLWHGANFNSIFWGALHGLGLITVDLWTRVRERQGWRPMPAPLGWALCFVWLNFSFIFFRCPRFEEAIAFLMRFQKIGVGLSFPHPAIWAVGLFALFAIHWWASRSTESRFQPFYTVRTEVFAAILGLTAALALFLTPLSSPPFIYFQF